LSGAGGLYLPERRERTLQYDNLNRLTSLGAFGNRTGVTELSGRKVSYGYDNLYRITAETITNSSVSGIVGYQYDAVGNRKSIASTLPTINTWNYTYDANDRITGFAAPAYDNDGNTVMRAGIADSYDFENHLVQHGGMTFVYDGDGNRVAKTVGGVTTGFLVDTLNPTGYAQVLDELQNNTVTRSYNWGLQQVSETQLTDAPPPANPWTTSYYGFDGHGSVRYLTDSTGVVTDIYDYDAFGNLINSTGSTPNNYLFAGEQFDPDLGLYYNRARYLDMHLGRFWGMDTEEGDDDDPVSLHKYLYTEADPIDGLDPSGHDDLAGVMMVASMSVSLDAMAVPNKAACTACSVQMPADANSALLARLAFAEGIPTQTGMWAIASVVVNRVNSGRSGEFGSGLTGVIYQQYSNSSNYVFNAIGDPKNTLWPAVATQAGIQKLNPKLCLTYQYAVTAAQNALAGNTNTDAVIYYDDSIPEPKIILNGMNNGTLLTADVYDAGGSYIDNPDGNGQYFFKYAPSKPKKKKKHGGNN
jgi:RHS repeat-associated protein